MSPQIKISDDADTLAGAVAEALIERLAEIQAEGRIPDVCLSGGTTAALVHRKVASSMNGLDVDWDEVNFWWGDERYVAASSEERNALHAHRDLLDPVEADPARVHEMPALDSGMELAEAALAYSTEVRNHGSGGFDIVMLGMGPDGHIASLFPGSDQVRDDDHIAVAVPDSPKPPSARISLTLGALNRARSVWFLVPGAGKAEAVAASLVGQDPLRTPASGVSGELETIWWLDKASSSSVEDRND